MKSARYFWITALSCLLILSCTNLFGQATATSSLQGTVIDKSQAVLSGAEVTLTNKATGVVRSAKTDNTGVYKFASVPAGIYDIKVANSGFAGVSAKNVELLVGATTTQNFTLNPGGVSETVEVTGTAPLVDQQKTDVGQTVTPEQIQELPLIGRDIQYSGHGHGQVSSRPQRRGSNAYQQRNRRSPHYKDRQFRWVSI